MPSNSTLQVAPVVRVLAGLTYTSISLVGLGMYTVVALVVMKHWNQIKNPFYTIVCHLAISDIGFSFVDLIHMAPLIFSPTSVYPKPLSFVLAQFHTVFAVSLFLQSFTLTFERFNVFLCLRLHAELFEYGRVHYTMAVTWVIMTVMVIHPLVFGCYIHFEFHFHFDCAHPEDMDHVLPIMLFTGLSATVMMGMYLAVFVHLKRNKSTKVATSQQEAKRQRARARAERRLLLQGFIICFVLQLLAGTFWLAPPDRAWGPMLISLFCCLNCACNPTIYLTFNKTIRAKVALLFGLKPNQAQAAKPKLAAIQEEDQV